MRSHWAWFTMWENHISLQTPDEGPKVLQCREGVAEATPPQWFTSSQILLLQGHIACNTLQNKLRNSKEQYPSIHRDHTLYRALVLPKQSPGLLGTILDGSPLRRRILKWLNHPSKLELISPTSEGWQAESTPPAINSTDTRDFNWESQAHHPNHYANTRHNEQHKWLQSSNYAHI